MNEGRLSILLIEDDQEDSLLIEEFIRDSHSPFSGSAIKRASRLSEGMDCLLRSKADLVMLDLGLPDSQGLTTLRKLCSMLPDLPIVVLTGLLDEQTGVEAVKAGAQDYLVKGHIDGNLLMRSVQYALERKRAENTIKRMSRNNELILSTAGEGIFGLDIKGNFSFVNPAAARMLGHTADELIGLNSHDTCHHTKPDGTPYNESECRIYEAMRSGKTQNAFDEFFWRKDGTYFYVEYTSAPIVDEGAITGCVVTFRDVSERKKIEHENSLLRDEIKAKKKFECIIGSTSGMLTVLETVINVSRTDSSVLIKGETGTGKELVADAIYALSPRCDKPFIRINCAAIPETLLESELFGYEKGAFTGANQRRKGKFEAADGGTIFLDEIGDMPLSVQAKLLRVLEYRTFERLGGHEPITVDVRIIYATRKDLLCEVREGRFREDLYYRINNVPVTLPPLRERKEDITMLVNYFLDIFSVQFGKTGLSLGPDTLPALLRHDYPGNVRELKHAIETAVIMCRDTVVRPEHFAFTAVSKAAAATAPLVDLGEGGLQEGIKSAERRIIINALEGSGGKKKEAAEALGISRETLWRKLKEHGLERYCPEIT